MTHAPRSLLPILAILLLASAARIVGAGDYPVWTDEGWSIQVASSHDVAAILSAVAQDRHPPLYFLAIGAWESLAGESRIALRFLSIAAGVLTVAAAYRIGTDAFGRRAGLPGALLLAALPIAVYYGQEVRHYGWLTLFACLTTLFFLRALRRPSHLPLWIAYTLSVALLLYTQYFGVLFLAVQGVIGLFLWRAPRREKARLVGAWIAAGVLYLPWLAVIVTQQLSGFAPGIGGFPGSLATTLPDLLTLAGLLTGGQAALVGGLVMTGMFAPHPLPSPPQRSEGHPLSRLTIFLCGVGLLIGMVAVNLKFGVLAARTVVFLTPMLMLTAGYGLSRLEGRAQGVFAALLVGLMLLQPQIVQPRLDGDLAAQAVAADYTPGDLIILETGWDDNAFRYELALALRDPGAEIVRTLPWVNQLLTPEPVVPHVIDAIRAHRRVWVVNWFQPSQVIPYLEAGEDGFRRVLTRETPTGEQYAGRFPDPAVEAVLFARPDLTGEPRVYGDLLALHDAVLPETARRGERLHVDLWWSAREPLSLDYSVGVFLLDNGGAVRAEQQGPPGDTPTSQWAVDELIFDRHTLSLPSDLSPGTYRLAVNAYWYADPQHPLAVEGQPLAVVGEIQIN